MINPSALRLSIRESLPFVFVTHSSAQTITDITDTTLSWNTDEINRWGMHDTVTNNERITFNVSGWYRVGCLGRWDSNGTGGRELKFDKNGTKKIAWISLNAYPAGRSGYMFLDTYYHFDVTDYVIAQVFQSSGGNLNWAVSTDIPYFFAYMIHHESAGTL